MNARRCGKLLAVAAAIAAIAVTLVAEDAVPLDKLVAQLSASDVAARREAIYRISKFGPGAKDALPAVIAALGDSDKQVWSLAIGTIADLGPAAAAAVPVLIDGLDPRQTSGPRYRKGSEVPFRSAYALSRIGPSAIPPLLETLKSNDPFARAAAARALGGMGPAAKNAIPPLIENLRGDEPLERRETIDALGAIGRECVAPLAAALGSGEASVRAGAALSLAQIGAEAKSLAPKIADLAATEHDPAVRGALFAAIPKLGVDPARGVPILIAGIRDDSATIRHDATNAIYVYRAAHPQIVAALTTLLRDVNQTTSERGAAVLGRLGPVAAPAVEALLEVARRRTPTNPIYLETLGRIGADAVPGIMRAVEKENPDAITKDHWSVRCVPVIGGEALPALAKALGDRSASVRVFAACGLGELGAVAAPIFDALKTATADADPRVRAAALAALVGTKAHTVVALSKVEAGLKDPAPNVRRTAAGLVDSLGELARSVAPTLLAALADSDPNVRLAVIDALPAVAGAARPALPRLLEVMPASDASTRVKILAVFAGIGPDARAALPEARKQSKDAEPTVRAAAVHAIARVDDPAARLPVMLAALDDGDVRVRVAAAEEIAILGENARDASTKLVAMLQREPERDVAFDALKKISIRSVPDLIALLTDRDLNVKSFAAKRLGSMGSAAREAIPAMNELLSRSGEREETRRVVREALKRIERGS